MKAANKNPRVLFVWIKFQTAKIGSLAEVTDSKDPEGLRVFYYLIQDLKVRSRIISHMHAVMLIRSSNF